MRTFALCLMLMPLTVFAAEPARAEFEAYSQRIPGTDVTFEMAPIPGGRFLMGSPADEPGREPDEGPRVEVIVEPFWMGRHEVTWGEYLPFMELHQHVGRKRPATALAEDVDAVTFPTPLFEIGLEAYPGFPDQIRRPAANMTHYAAQQYTKWLSQKTGHFYRLPTEAEWEYAARAGSKTSFSFGDDAQRLKEYGWYWRKGDERSHAVGQKLPNAWGLHDMHGNVAEWVFDRYEADAYMRIAPGPRSAAEIIVWPTEKYPHVIRGGSWYDDPEMLRSASRAASSQDFNDQEVQIPESITWHTSAEWLGFRVVRPLVDPDIKTKRRFWDTVDAEAMKLLRDDVNVHGRDMRVPPKIYELP